MCSSSFFSNCSALVGVLTSLPVLSHICLSGCGLDSSSIPSILHLLHHTAGERNTKLWQQQLRADCNENTITTQKRNQEEFTSGGGLISLDLSNNDLNDECIESLCRVLSRDVGILALNFSGNSFSNVGLKELLTMLNENFSCMKIVLQHFEDDSQRQSILQKLYAQYDSSYQKRQRRWENFLRQQKQMHQQTQKQMTPQPHQLDYFLFPTLNIG